MRNIKLNIYTILALCVAFLSSCHHYDEPETNVYSTFDTLWETIDTRYCYLEEKDIDWKAIGQHYRVKIKTCETIVDFFNLCSNMLSELKDGHVNLSSPFDTYYYRKWWTDYDQNFSLRTLQEYYLHFDYSTTSGINYKVLDGGVGYIYYPTFATAVGEGNLDLILTLLADCKGLIIDVRNNGGGELTNIDTFVSRFIDHEITGGYIRHKTGPGHSDFSDYYPIKYKPCHPQHVKWKKPIIVLTNRSCFSAANDFASVMKQLPNVKICGAKTGGGGGIPFIAQLPIGWKVRFSACPVYDAEMHSIENGVEPSEGYALSSPDQELAAGHDAILSFAIKKIEALPESPEE